MGKSGHFSVFLGKKILLESVLISPGHLVITGDFNIHVDVPGNCDTKKFSELLQSFGLHQHISQPTHDKGHTLDLVITRIADPCAFSFSVDNSLPSDHAAVCFKTMVQRPAPKRTTQKHRTLKNIDMEVFKQIFNDSLCKMDSIDNVDTLASNYHYAASATIDKLAPIKSRNVIDKPRAKWFSENLVLSRARLRSFERKWLKTKLTIDRNIFVKERLMYKKLCDDQKIQLL